MSRSAGAAAVGLALAALLAVAGCSEPGSSGQGSSGQAATSAPASATPPGTTAPSTTAPTPTATPEPACETGWGSAQKAVPGLGPDPVIALRTSGDRCADRVEFDLAGPASGYTVGYVEQIVQDGSGAPITVPGGARLLVQLNHPAYDSAGQSTLPGRLDEPLPSVSGYRSLQSVVFAGSFEGVSAFGVGVRARLPFRVQVLDGDRARSRIVLEVAHSWS